MEQFTCPECGRKFKTKEGLRQHTNDKHHQRKVDKARRTQIKLSTGKLILISIVAIFVISVVLIFFFANPAIDLSRVGQPVSQQFYLNMTSVNDSVLNAVGIGSIKIPCGGPDPTRPIPGQGFCPVTDPPLTDNNKSLVLYVGAEFCPYCAATRWGFILALSRFGNLSGLEYMVSSSNERPGLNNILTFSFSKASLSSNYNLSFQGPETADRYSHPIETQYCGTQLCTLTPLQSDNYQTYDVDRTLSQGGQIPFINFGNRYVLVGSVYDPTTIDGKSWDQISEAMKDPSSDIAKAIDGSANVFISAICKMTNSTPSSVCDQPYAKLDLSQISKV